MRRVAEMAHATWWAFAVAGVAAVVAAAASAIGLATPAVAAGAWQLVAGLTLLAAMTRLPGRFRDAIPFLGIASVGVVLGAAGLLLPATEDRISLIAIGIWCVVAGASYRAVSRIARAFGVPDGGLGLAAWASIGVGVAVSTLPAFKLGSSLLVTAGALAAAGIVTILASLRLRDLPDEAPPVLSNREVRRRERQPPGR